MTDGVHSMNWKVESCGGAGEPFPRNYIPYEGDLENDDIIENPYNKRLIYNSNTEKFLFITESPMTEYLNKEDIYSNWKKI